MTSLAVCWPPPLVFMCKRRPRVRCVRACAAPAACRCRRTAAAASAAARRSACWVSSAGERSGGVGTLGRASFPAPPPPVSGLWDCGSAAGLAFERPCCRAAPASDASHPPRPLPARPQLRLRVLQRAPPRRRPQLLLRLRLHGQGGWVVGGLWCGACRGRRCCWRVLAARTWRRRRAVAGSCVGTALVLQAANIQALRPCHHPSDTPPTQPPPPSGQPGQGQQQGGGRQGGQALRRLCGAAARSCRQRPPAAGVPRRRWCALQCGACSRSHCSRHSADPSSLAAAPRQGRHCKSCCPPSRRHPL